MPAAPIRHGPIRWPRNSAERRRTKIGAVKNPATTCAMGRTPSAA
jgi:hypothetical protein